MEGKLTVVFDYDWSLINTNSDTYVFMELEKAVYEYIAEQVSSGTRKGQWTAIVDEGLVMLQQKYGVSMEQIAECLANVPVLPGMVETVEFAAENLIPVHIVSDASQVFIDVFLEKRKLREKIASVHTNLSWIEEGTGSLRVKPYHDQTAPHGCQLCPPNLCKGLVMEERLKLVDSDCTIVYVGDGSGDFCAARKLRERDILLVRNDPNYPSALGLVKRIEKERENFPILARIVHWTEGTEVLETVKIAWRAGLESSQM